MCVTAVPWIMCRQNTTPCHYTSHFVQWFKIFASPVYWMSACMTACSRSLLSASPSKAFLRRVLHSIVILSFSLTSSPPPYILIFSLVTFPLCQLPSLCTFPAFLSVPARPAPHLFYSSPKISSFFPAITYSIPFSFSFFFSPHSASCLRARFPHAFIVYSCCFPTCSPPFPSSFLPSHTFLSVQHVISSLLLHINPSSEWATWICLWPRSFCSSGTLENQERAYHLTSHPLMSACEVRVIKPGTIWQLAFVCLHHKCISLGCACSAFAYGSQFVGGDGCVCGWVCESTYRTVCLSVCQAGSLKWILAGMYQLFFRKEEPQDYLALPVS